MKNWLSRGRVSATSRVGSAPQKNNYLRPSTFVWAALFLWVLAILFNSFRPLPEGVSFDGNWRSVDDVRFLFDLTYVDEQGDRHSEQQIFDGILQLIEHAERFVLVDMFLFNNFQGVVKEEHRALSDELTDALIAKKRQEPDINIQVISDPLNTLYGGMASPHFNRLTDAGISVTLTDLTRLRDSNPIYSSLWRVFVQPFGNSPGNWLPNPFGEGRVSLRSYLTLLNFKANHRKLIIADEGEQFAALVTSANPHDGSSAHGNVALRFKGAAAQDLLTAERAVLKFSGARLPNVHLPVKEERPTPLSLKVVTERAVERAALSLIDDAEPGDRLDLAMFYLSDRDIVRALQRAHERGAQLRVLLDPNKDAFGREKNGVPNRPVAHALVRAGITVRWCNTHGEQCHAKWLMHRGADGRGRLLLGSTNFTRRNLHNLNLETSVVLRGPLDSDPLAEASSWFEQHWNNQNGRQFSVGYAVYADDGLWPQLLYRIMEASGLSTF